MSKMIDGYFSGTELAFRCFQCGDSQRHPDKAHASVNVFSSKWFCFRCQSGGLINPYDLALLTRGLMFDRSKMTRGKAEFDTGGVLEAITTKMKSGSAIPRYSALDRYHLTINNGVKVDVFKVTDVEKRIVGYHIRHPTDKALSRTYGQKMFGIPSTIKYSRPWRIVEGPYDAVDPQSDVVVWGFPSKLQAQRLQGKELILCPDGDVFEDYRKLASFMRPFIWDNSHIIKHIERLPPGVDPDELFPSQREKMTVEEMRKMLTPKRSFFINRMTPKQIMEKVVSQIPEEEFWEGVQ